MRDKKQSCIIMSLHKGLQRWKMPEEAFDNRVNVICLMTPYGLIQNFKAFAFPYEFISSSLPHKFKP